MLHKHFFVSSLHHHSPLHHRSPLFFTMDINHFIDQLLISSNNIDSSSQYHTETPNDSQSENNSFSPPMPSNCLSGPPHPVSPTITNHSCSPFSPMRPGQRRPLDDPISPERIRRPSPGLSPPPSPDTPSGDHITPFLHSPPSFTDNPSTFLLSPLSLHSSGNLTTAVTTAPNSGSSSPYSMGSPIIRLNSQATPSPTRQASDHVKSLINNADLSLEHRNLIAQASHVRVYYF